MVVGHRPQNREFLSNDRSREVSELVDKIFSMLRALFEQTVPTDNIEITIEALSLMVTLMCLVKDDDRLWEPARLCMKGAFSGIGQVPRVDDLNIILEFLHHHISSQRRSTFGDEPIYHSFRAIVDSSDDRSHQRFTGFFTSPLFIDTIVEALSNRGYKDLQEMVLILLPELDSHLFATAFPHPGKAQALVNVWWTAVESCRTGKSGRVDVAVAQVFFAIVNSPCLRENIPPDAWKLTDTFHFIIEATPASLQRCTRNTDLIPFVSQASPRVGLPSWMSMLWMEHDSLSREVLDQMEEVTRKTAYKECEISATATMLTRTHHCKSWIQTLNSYLGRWEKSLKDLDPSDQAVPGLRARWESATKARKRLLEIQDVQRNPPPARWWWEEDDKK
ncbi:hypothetical protein BJ322DRAFT_171771 [Thelephora terrestris]|uniref:Uncharacterized protein n=1 Tax=Thelephora terrestris TaxID=56493 RepID=A0A9P6HAU5_9AGAM|nr:hypothetical protein BJ322DRAFT_171771 [Thelephora terrestris]